MALTCETVRLTKRVVDAAKCLIIDHTPKQKLYMDTDLKGFGLCVGTNAKTFFVQRDIAGKSIRVTIGRYGVFTVDQARDEARQLLAKMARGINPNEEKRKAFAKGISFEDGWKLYKSYLLNQKRSKKTIDRYEHTVQTYLTPWLKRPLATLSRQEVRAKHIQIAKDIADGKYSKGRKRTDTHGLTTANDAMRVESPRVSWRRFCLS